MAVSRPVRVVLVDDYAPLRQLMRELLEERGCHVVAEAGDGQAAVQAAAVGCDVVVMDLFMPEMNGIEATAAIARHHPDVEVVAFTTQNDPATAAAMLGAGATRHFSKTDHRGLIEHIVSAPSA